MLSELQMNLCAYSSCLYVPLHKPKTHITTWYRFCIFLHNIKSNLMFYYQRWSPRGRPWPRGCPREHILKTLAVASKPQVLENCPVLDSRTALFFECLKFCRLAEYFFVDRILWNMPEKNFEDLFFENTCILSLVLGIGLEHSCPWPRECLS